MSDLIKLQALLMGWEALRITNPDQAESLAFQALDLTREMIEKRE